jgi:hypothetical protein
MKHFFSALFCLFSTGIFAQLSFGIAAQGFGNSWDDAASVTYDTQNNVYVTGYFSSDSIRFGNHTLHNNGGTDLYVVKYDAVLNVLWALSAGGTGDEYGMGISCDSSDRIVVVGNYSGSTITLGQDVLVNHAAGTPDMFIARIDANGNFVWARSEGASNWDNCAGVDMNTITGDIYVSAAYYLGAMIIENDTLPNRGGYDMVLMKFDINGNYQWSRHAGGNYNDLANAVAYDAAGFVVTSGGFASDTLKFPTDTLLNPVMGLPETFVVKYDEAGNCLWAHRSGAGDNDHSVAVDIGPNGNIYVGGHYHSGGFAFGSDTLINQGQGDVYLLVYDSNGNPLWGKSAGGLEHDFGYNIYVDATGRIYYSGMFTSISITFGSYTHNNSNINEDMFMTVYDANGNETGSLSAGGLGMDYIASTVVNSSGDVYMVGSFGTPVLTIGSSALTNTDASGNTADMFIATSSFPLSLPSPAETQEVRVAPNPGNGIFNFSSRLDGVAVVHVYNTLGEEIVSRTENNARSFSVDLTGEPSGIYFVNVLQNGAVQQVRIVKE